MGPGVSHGKRPGRENAAAKRLFLMPRSAAARVQRRVRYSSFAAVSSAAVSLAEAEES